MAEQAFKGTVLDGRERRYTILNLRDYNKYITDDLDRNFFEDALNDVLEQIEAGRIKDGKEPFNCYLVINLDEPYVNEVIEIMKRNGHMQDIEER